MKVSRSGRHAAVFLLFTLCLTGVRLPAKSSPPADLAILPAITVATNVANADSNYYRPGRPGIATDGTNYLVLSCRFDSAPAGVFGVLLSSKGTLINSFFITVADQFANPTAAFDGTNYLVVFQRGGVIYGLRVSPSGLLLDAPEGFQISSGPSNSTSWGPRLAFDGNNYLVVWHKYDGVNYTNSHDIFAAFVSPSGISLGEFKIFAGPGEQSGPDVAFGAGTYLVVWRDDRNNLWPKDWSTDIYAARVSPQGVVLDPAAFPICTAAGYQEDCAVATDGHNFLVVWTDGRQPDSGYDIFSTRVSPNGWLLDGPPDTGGLPVNVATGDQISPGVCFDGLDYVVAWWNYSYSPPVGMFCTRVTTAGCLRDGPAADSGILVASPDAIANLLVLPAPACNGQSILLSYLANNEYSGQTKSVAAQLLVPKPVLTRIDSDQANSANLTLTISARDRQRFSIETARNLSPSILWQTLQTNLVGSTNLLAVPLPGIGTGVARFFRLAVDY